MRKESFIAPFSQSEMPVWNCPYCLDGILKLNKNSLNIKETEESKSYHKHEDFEPDWIRSNFSLELECDHCKERIFSVGKTKFIEFMDDEYGPRLEEGLIPLFFYPAIPLFKTSKNCPKDVQEQIESAFSLYWNDISASANRIRVVVEIILNHAKIKKGEKIKNSRNRGKIRKLSLHKRILIFKDKNQSIGEAMLAIKWIGNFGSHTDDLVQTDVLNAFELLEHTLSEVFDKKSEEIKKLSKNINKKKGPMKNGETS